MSEPRKSAIVTGAGSGIGRAVALALVGAGFRVAAAGRRRAALDATASAAGDRARDVMPVVTDVGEAESVAQLFATVGKEFGRLDLLFNNAGIGSPAVPLEELPLATLRAVIDTNLFGAFVCTQHAIRMMKSQTPRGGRIINNGSISAQVPRRNSIAYTATKHAVTGLTKSIALDGRDFDIACGQIDVGRIDSEIGATGATANPSSIPKLDTQLAAQAVLQMANLPIEANMLFTTLLPTKMPFVGRG